MRMHAATAIIILVVSITAHAQEAPQVVAPIDMTSPTAVVSAYLDACAKGDTKATIDLVVAEGNAAKVLQEVFAQANREQAGQRLRVMLAEYTFLPMPMPAPAQYTAPQGAAEGDQAQIRVTENRPLEKTFVLRKQADGTWRIDLEASIKATTGLEESFIFAVFSGRPQTVRRATQITLSHRENNMRTVLSQLLQYIRAHTNTVPFGETWMDEVEEYSLRGNIFVRPGVEEGQFGYALNANLVGLPLPRDWNDRQNTALIYESSDLSRNAVGDPDDELMAEDSAFELVVVGLASGNTGTIPHGTSLQEAAEHWKAMEVCQEHVRVLLTALFDYARDNEGTLPPADCWCDYIMPYVDERNMTVDLFECPERPELECAYAINAELAGKDIRKIADQRHWVLLLPAKEGILNEARSVPDNIDGTVHINRWGRDAKKHAIVGMLSGSIQFVPEGGRYPKPPQEAPQDN